MLGSSCCSSKPLLNCIKVYGIEPLEIVQSFNAPRQIVIIVSPPFWETWEFYVGLGLGAFLLIWLVYLLRVKAIKRQQRRLAFLVERRTKTITKQKNQIEQQNRKIEKEKEKADQLLINIL